MRFEFSLNVGVSDVGIVMGIVIGFKWPDCVVHPLLPMLRQKTSEQQYFDKDEHDERQSFRGSVHQQMLEGQWSLPKRIVAERDYC
jgi:hypothetical protein